MIRPVVLHISNDFPDCLQPDKTRAVQALVDGTADIFDHHVYSLNRIDGWKGIAALPFGENRTAIAYKALPKGILWEDRLDEVADWIITDLTQKAVIPDLVEAHKFTVEGLVGQKIAAHFKKPLICDIQGDTDTKILQAKPKLRDRYRAIAKDAALVLPYARWPIAAFTDACGLDPQKCRLLPVAPGIDALHRSDVCDTPRLIAVFNLDSYRRKNIAGIIAAISRILPQFPDLTIDIYGRGGGKALIALRGMIERSGLNNISVMGPIENGRLPELIGQYSALVQPSFRESYGLVYAEALFSGVPVLFSKNRGIDGILNTADIGYAADPHSIADIASGISHVIRNEAVLKERIALLQDTGKLDVMRKDAILRIYREALLEILEQRL